MKRYKDTCHLDYKDIIELINLSEEYIKGKITETEFDEKLKEIYSWE